MRVTKKLLHVSFVAVVATTVLALSACAPQDATTGGTATAGGGPAEVTVGVVTSETGPLAGYGKQYLDGFKAGLDYATDGSNEVDGTKITVDYRDDAGDPDTAVGVAKELIGQGVNILAGSASSGVAAAVAEQAGQNKVLFISGPAAADALTGVNAYTFRSGRQSAQDVATAGTFLGDLTGKTVTVFAQNNAFGKEVFTAARQSMDRLKLPEAVTATVENNASDAGSAAAKLAAGNLEAIVIGLAGKPTLEFVKAFRALKRGVTLYALSVMGTPATVKALGADATGMAISQVVPLPSNVVMPVVREFQAAWKASGATAEPSHLALEGYINARVFAEALQRAGRNPTRAAFIDATWNLKKWDLGGFEISASTPDRNASRFVELTLVGRDGRFLR